MSSKAKVIGTCDICKREFTARNERILGQVIGFHKRKAHQIAGVFSTPEGKRRAARQRHWKLQGLSEAEIADKEKAFAEKDAARAAAAAATATTAPPGTAPLAPIRRKKKGQSDAEPLGLKECACCETEFFVKKKGERSITPIRLSSCPCCTARFYVARD